ncbi:alpha/beta fold hydrolase [Georgenia sp. SUBG003]|uniref:alpha/beta fold hydrolase n=1 Tax=Georgenia sp. SUBG003 TaxID=1497974 RepID=UPI0004D8BA3C|nr:hypothetical protein DA06_05680 [Georgenia sp. SUBG003]
MKTSRRRPSAPPLLAAALTLLLGAASAAGARTVEDPGDVPVPELAWAACGTTPEGTAAGVQCATARLPMDYDEPDGEQVELAVARVPARDAANRIGSLFVNLGGPGGTIVDVLQRNGGSTWAALNQRFDLVGFDPRGVGQSAPAVDCQVNPEELGLSAQPFPTPLDIDRDAWVARAQEYVDSCLARNGDILEHLSTANVARDMEVLRDAVGDEELTYLGYSYGTFLGATYAALFPEATARSCSTPRWTCRSTSATRCRAAPRRPPPSSARCSASSRRAPRTRRRAPGSAGPSPPPPTTASSPSPSVPPSRPRATRWTRGP